MIFCWRPRPLLPASRYLTDHFLPALAVKYAGRFATFDFGINAALVSGGNAALHLIPSFNPSTPGNDGDITSNSASGLPVKERLPRAMWLPRGTGCVKRILSQRNGSLPVRLEVCPSGESGIRRATRDEHEPRRAGRARWDVFLSVLGPPSMVCYFLPGRIRSNIRACFLKTPSNASWPPSSPKAGRTWGATAC